MTKRYTSLSKLEPENIGSTSTKRLKYVLETLSEADELTQEFDYTSEEGGLCWQSEIWQNCTIEELLGALIEADYVMRSSYEHWGGIVVPDIIQEKINED